MAYRCAEKKGIFSSSNITSNIHILILFSNRFFVLFCVWIFFFLLFFRGEAHVHTQTDTALWSLDLAVATPVEKDDRSQAKTMRMDGTDATWLFSIGKLGQREGEKEEEEEKKGVTRATGWIGHPRLRRMQVIFFSQSSCVCCFCAASSWLAAQVFDSFLFCRLSSYCQSRLCSISPQSQHEKEKGRG